MSKTSEVTKLVTAVKSGQWKQLHDFLDYQIEQGFRVVNDTGMPISVDEKNLLVFEYLGIEVTDLLDEMLKTLTENPELQKKWLEAINV